MKQKYQNKKEEYKKIARERIEILFEEARKQFSKDPNRSNRYVTLARKMAMKFKVRMPSHLKRQFCKHCYTFLMPSANCRVRVSGGEITYFCHTCKKFSKFGYRREQKEKRALPTR